MIATAIWAVVAATGFAGTLRIDPVARPSAPTNLTARALSPSVAELRWEHSSEKKARWFRVEYQEGEKIEDEKGGYKFRALGFCGPTTTTFRATSLKPGVGAMFRVTAINDAGESVPSPIASVALPAAGEEPAKAAASTGHAGFKAFLGYFPSRRKLFFTIDAARTAKEADALDMKLLENLTLDLSVTDIETGKVILNQKSGALSWPRLDRQFMREKFDGLVSAEFAVDTPELDGIYQVTAKLINPAGAVVRTFDRDEQGQPLQFERRRFAWESNKLGLSEKVYPPFTPITVKDRTVGVVLREHRLSELGLPESVVARGKELLAGGVTLNLTRADGKRAEWQQLKGTFVKTAGHVAVYEGSAATDELAVRIRNTIEVDGAMKIEMQLTPGAGKSAVRGLSLDIPIRPEMAKLEHVLRGLGTREPSYGPPRPRGFTAFMPYIWLGEMDRGFAVFGDNEQNFMVDAGRPIQEIVTENGRTLIRVHFINSGSPVQIAEPRTIVFGLQASPTKPMPDDFRKPTKPVPPHGGNSTCWGMHSTHGCRHPDLPLPTFAPDDPDWNPWHIIDQWAQARRENRSVDKKYVDDWLQKHYGKMNKTDFDWYQKNLYTRFQRKLTNEESWAAFWSFYNQTIFPPEWPTYQDEWNARDFRVVRRGGDWAASRHFWRSPESRGYQWTGPYINCAPSLREFVAWQGREWYSRGIGVYDDNGYQRVDNLEMNDTFLREEKNGKGAVVPSHNLWEIREYNKRNWVLLREVEIPKDVRVVKIHHMTGDMVLPINTWNDVDLDTEWSDHGTFSPDQLRAHSTGRQVGVYPHVLQPLFRPGEIKRLYKSGRKAGINWADGGGDPEKWPEQFNSEELQKAGVRTKDDLKAYSAFAFRADWGMHVTHEILRKRYHDMNLPALNAILDQSGYGTDEAMVFNYWQEESPIAVEQALVKLEVVEKGAKEDQIWLGGAKELNPNAKVGDVIDMDVTPRHLFVQRGDSGLIVLQGWNPKPLHTTVTLRGVSAAKAVDAESKAELAIQNGKIALQLDKWGLKLIRLEGLRGK
jgi:hypothetical protein